MQIETQEEAVKNELRVVATVIAILVVLSLFALAGILCREYVDAALGGE